ncbi:Putative deoxyribonuclease RhsC [Burkholderiales bacterium]|nr:Putative deoxyribonuclease RhsC [Burkholderiales bacterium]
MARIPEAQIERLKREISVERLVESAGIELKKAGKDKIGRCPFHEDGPRIETTFDERGLATRVEYDELHQPVRSTYTYDALGQMLTQTVHGATPAETATTTFSYDDHGNLQSRTDPLGHTSTWTYNALGQALSHTDALGRVTRYEYDAAGRLLAVIDAKEQTRSYRYDAAGNRNKTIDPLGRETLYQYDALDRLTQTTDPLNGETIQHYDAEGRLTHRTDPAGLSTTYQYDSEGRLTQITDPASLATRVVQPMSLPEGERLAGANASRASRSARNSLRPERLR